MASTKRDVRNHILFEVATEVANRGKWAAHRRDICHCVELIYGSGWHLLGAQVQGTGDDCRVWVAVYAFRTSQPRFGKLAPAAASTAIGAQDLIVGIVIDESCRRR